VESFAPYLDLAIKAARAAGDLLRVDFHRPAGPRGEYDKSPADTEAEQLIQNILLSGDGQWGFLGEETDRVPGAKGAPIWVVDPNDGTRDYIKGRRGSSVSIALVWDRRPVLGVVHPFGYPGDDGPVYSAAVGREGVWKDGAPVSSTLPETLTDLDVVLISGGGDRAARANLQCARPARVMAIPSIAHRLARVACGEASAATSLYSPKTWDFAAGHCLILAAGGVIVDQNGNEPVYGGDASGIAPRLFAGSRAVALELSSRNWDLAFRSPRESDTPIVRLAKGGGVRNPHLLARGQGALLGHLAGSALGALFSGPESGAIKDPLSAPSIETAALRRRVLAGQPGSAGELAIAVGRSLIDFASDRKSLSRVYADWAQSSPIEPDRAIESAVRGEPLADNLSAMALARVTPLAVWGHAADPLILAVTVRTDIALTHPAPIAGDAAAVLAIIMQALLQGRDPSAALADGHAFARQTGCAREVIAAIVDSYELPKTLRGARETPSVVGALQAALFHLTRSRSFEESLEWALATGSHSDALPACVGAVLGARFGREGIPLRLRNLVLSSRAMEGLATPPRPSTYWGTDAMAMAEALLTSR
jgi:fructose-1,6-bisphosphatase/inositol monophosphatase family enzyme/ADP-ribosylglycohydrolase